jgi:hypothetical protein
LRRFIRRTPSPALVIAIIALFVALGGVSSGLVGRATVFSDDIVNNTVKSKDIKNNGVKGKDVRTDTLNGSDIVESSLGRVPGANNANNADDSDELGGVPASGYQRTSRLLFGAATTTGGTFTVIPERSQGLVGGAVASNPGFFEFEFDRDVSSCTWLASAGNTGVGTAAFMANPRAPRAGQPNTRIGVVVFDAAGAQANPNTVFVEVLCPS